MFFFRNKFLLLVSSPLLFCSCSSMDEKKIGDNYSADCWTGAGEFQIPSDSSGQLIRYGRQLIAHTARYLGPKGNVAHLTNGMNCQNCHLDAGTKPWGNNYGSVASTYPLFRDRSGSIETIEKRINDCLQRSLHGQPIDSNSREMRAMKAYINWLGSEVPKGQRAKGSGIMLLPFLDRAADSARGKIVFLTHCARCHQENGQGLLDSIGVEYIYPPLWGPNSYTTGAGMYRLSKLAGYVFNNMPHTVTYHQPQLSTEEAWDVAAYINTRPRPVVSIASDWPRISTKPFDHPIGPYADGYSEQQHKLGPWIWGKKK